VTPYLCSACGRTVMDSIHFCNSITLTGPIKVTDYVGSYRDYFPAATQPDRDFDGFCTKAEHPEFAGWCGGFRRHKLGCPCTRKANG